MLVPAALPVPSAVGQGPGALERLVIVGEHHPALSGIQVLAGLEAEGARASDGADPAPAPFGQVRLRGILDQDQPFPARRSARASISAGQPPMCTATIARVRSVTAASAAAGSRFIVRGSTSAKTGIAFTWTAADTVAIKV